MDNFQQIKYDHIKIEKTFGVLEGILSDLPENYKKIHLNAKTFGKRVKKWPLNSKFPLTTRELKNYTIDLINIYKQWGSRPDNSELNNWNIREADGLRFTIVLERKEDC